MAISRRRAPPTSNGTFTLELGAQNGCPRVRYGETLVVETTNFRDKRPYYAAGMFTTQQMRLVERFTRVGADTIDYQFTVDDPTTWTTPWTAAVPIVMSKGKIFEFACHEGNYALPHVLSGARAQEKAAAESAKKGVH
jgi:hypothetical protein